MTIPLPATRGPLTESLLAYWAGGPAPAAAVHPDCDPLVDDDLQLALWCCYELHYRGFDGVDDAMEWDPPTIAFRRSLEARFEHALRTEHACDGLPRDPGVALRILASRAGPPLSSTMEREGTRRQLAEFAIHRSVYQLKEADPHTWAIPRLDGRARSAYVEIQLDEYGRGEPGQSHHELFAAAMTDLGLDATFGHYVDHVPGTTLATDNLVTMFGLHRRLRGAAVGHLALFETTSVGPMSRYLAAARRLGGMPALERFYEVHVEADAHHGALALRGLVDPFVARHPELADEVIFGAAALSRVEARFARHILQSWDEGRSSLRTPALAPHGPVRTRRRPARRTPAATATAAPADSVEPAGQVA